MITVQQVTYNAGRKRLLTDISFTALPGQITAVIGANGAGKSTLLRLLSGEIQPASGSISMNGQLLPAYKLPELARMRAVLTQQHTLSLAFTVQELVLMGRYAHFERQPSAHDMAMVNEAMLAAGVVHLAGRTYHTLSGGEQQRVQLARVIAQIQDAPNGWLLLDEPTNGLDLLHQQQLMQQARQMATRGYGVICILHDLNLAATYAHQIILLKEGKLLAQGRPADVIHDQYIYQAFGIHIQLIKHQDLPFPLVVNSGLINH